MAGIRDIQNEEQHLERSRRVEEELGERLRGRVRQSADSADAHRAPDPARKRLEFLLAKARDQAQAAEEELAALREMSNRS
jgi:hypothetical protein